MATKQDFYTRQFSHKQVDEAKKRTEEKNLKLKYNNLGYDKGTRYVGLIGEWAFYYFLKSRGLEPGTDFVAHNKRDQVDKADFTIGTEKITVVDVKTICRTVEPLENYGCDVIEEQLDRLTTEDNPVDTLVFVSFNSKNNKATIVGYLPLTEFIKIAKYYEKGHDFGENKAKISASMYEVLVSDLFSIKDLLPEKPMDVECYFDECENRCISSSEYFPFCSQEHKSKYWLKEEARLPIEKQRAREKFFNK